MYYSALNKALILLSGGKMAENDIYGSKGLYETYSENKKLSPLVRQLNWSNHLLILSKTKSMEKVYLQNYVKIIKRNYKELDNVDENIRLTAESFITYLDLMLFYSYYQRLIY